MTSMIEIAIQRAANDKNLAYIQLACVANQRVVEVAMEPIVASDHSRIRVGDIYCAKVVRLLPAMRMAFVEIGEQRTALLHFAQVPLPLVGAYTDAAQFLRVGQILPVQVIKLPRGEKGAVVSGLLQLVGPGLIYQPYGNHINVSQRISTVTGKQGLKEMAENFLSASSGGITVRTLAQQLSETDLRAEWQLLQKEWQNIEAVLQQGKKPQLLRAEWSLCCCYVRDQISNIKMISVGDPESYAVLRDFMQTWLKPWQPCLQFTPGKRALWYKYKIDEVIQQALKNKLPLPSGGYIVVETTEAMVTIDVNTGPYVQAKTGQDIAYQTNLEAARFIAHYLRLVNLAGIIVVDFIGMQDNGQQAMILATLQQELAHDSARTVAYGFSPLGLVEISRQRRGNPWIDYYR